MRINNRLLPAIAVLLTFNSCQADESALGKDNAEMVNLSVGLSVPVGATCSKVALSENSKGGYSVEWSDGDDIGAWYDSRDNFSQFNMVDHAPESSKFSGEVAANNRVYFIYPYLDNVTIKGSLLDLDFSTQEAKPFLEHLSATTYMISDAVDIGESCDVIEGLTMRHLGAVVDLDIKCLEAVDYQLVEVIVRGETLPSSAVVDMTADLNGEYFTPNFGDDITISVDNFEANSDGLFPAVAFNSFPFEIEAGGAIELEAIFVDGGGSKYHASWSYTNNEDAAVCFERASRCLIRANMIDLKADDSEDSFYIDTPTVVLGADQGATASVVGYSSWDWSLDYDSGACFDVAECSVGDQIVITLSATSRGHSKNERKGELRVVSNGETKVVNVIQVARITSNNPADNTYKYWGKYIFSTALSDIWVQPWSQDNHTIEGWDYSLPESVELSPSSQIVTDRSMVYGQKLDDLADYNFKINPTCEMWMTWNVIEPEEGQFNWAGVRNKIEEAKAQGYNVALRILTSAYTRNGDRSLGYAPLWLDAYDIDIMSFKGSSADDTVVCYDPMDPQFHSRYLNLIEKFGESGIPDLLSAAYVGYGYKSHGEEMICEYGSLPDTCSIVKERLDV